MDAQNLKAVKSKEKWRFSFAFLLSVIVLGFVTLDVTVHMIRGSQIEMLQGQINEITQDLEMMLDLLTDTVYYLIDLLCEYRYVILPPFLCDSYQ